MPNKNPFEYPCTNCPRRLLEDGRENTACMCKSYREWFKYEWEIVTKPFRDLKRDSEYRKTHERYVYK